MGLKACFAENVGKWRNLKCILIRNLHLLYKNNDIVALESWKRISGAI